MLFERSLQVSQHLWQNVYVFKKMSITKFLFRDISKEREHCHKDCSLSGLGANLASSIGKVLCPAISL